MKSFVSKEKTNKQTNRKLRWYFQLSHFGTFCYHRSAFSFSRKAFVLGVTRAPEAPDPEDVRVPFHDGFCRVSVRVGVTFCRTEEDFCAQRCSALNCRAAAGSPPGPIGGAPGTPQSCGVASATHRAAADPNAGSSPEKSELCRFSSFLSESFIFCVRFTHRLAKFGLAKSRGHFGDSPPDQHRPLNLPIPTWGRRRLQVRTRNNSNIYPSS